MIDIQNLHKQYVSSVAVYPLDVFIPQGSVFGLIGPNGAGKSTLLKALMGIVHPSGGRTLMLGHDVKTEQMSLRPKVGWIPQQKELYPKMTIKQFVEFYSGFYEDGDATEARRILDNWGVDDSQFTENISHGTKSKTLLSCLFARQPELMILDEPFAGLDAESTRDAMAHIADRAGPEGCTVILSTHRLDLAERICDRIGIMDAGQLKVSGRIDELQQSWNHFHVWSSPHGSQLRNWPEIRGYERQAESAFAISSDGDSTEQRLLSIACSSFERSTMNLAEIYMSLISNR